MRRCVVCVLTLAAAQQLDDATVIGALQAAAPSENFGGPPPARPLRIVQPIGGNVLRDVFGA